MFFSLLVFSYFLFKGFTEDILIKKLENISREMALGENRFPESSQPSSRRQPWKLGRCLIIIAVFQKDFLWLTKTMKSVPLKDLSYIILSEYPDL